MKAAVFILIIFFTLTPIYANDRISTKSFSLQAGFDEVAEIQVTPVPSQTQSYLIGMPFNIEDVYVQYGVTNNGRLIANWSLLVNTNFDMEIKAEQLRHESLTSVPLDYILTFEYKLGYYDDSGNINTRSGMLVYDTSGDGDGYVKYTDITEGIAMQSDSFIGNLDGGIYFMFNEDSTKKISESTESDLPAGNYQARVWMKITAKEGVQG